jgi:hypothetical protein
MEKQNDLGFLAGFYEESYSPGLAAALKPMTFFFQALFLSE